jgi:glyoxylase-like metal-dependent hydrolase (beta-lactamase superfamily II)
MVLITGSKRALLLDAGLGNGDLRAHVEALIGDLPLDVVISHGHPDHIAAMGQFQDRYDVYMNHRDVPMVQGFVDQMGYQIDMEQIEDLHEGVVFDLGDRRLKVYEVPGHSAGSVVLFDEEHGLLFASDAVGSNRPTIVDSLWMQFPGMAPIDEYLSTLQVFRSKLGAPIMEIYGGHNDELIYGERYLDNLQQAAQLLVDQGEAVLVLSLRPTDVWQVVVGDRLTDPNWVAINVAKERCLTVPADKIATLSNLQLRGAALEPGFTPAQLSYTAALERTSAALEIVPTATSSRYARLTINGAATTSGTPFTVPLERGVSTVAIAVTSPDGSATTTYTLVVTNPAG